VDKLEKKPNAGDGRSRAVEILLRGRISIAVEEQVLTAAGKTVLAVTEEQVLAAVGELAGFGAEEQGAP
jgi:hypothetical protein